jgi:L-iditol 2-dehydrogenase
MGHELSGKVAAVGSGVENLSPGRPVTSRTIVTHCGRCPLCIKGRENLCRAKTRLGFDHDGAFAQFVKVRQDQVHVLPEGLEPSVAVISEVFAVIVHALQPVTIKPTDTVVIMGPGPIGLVATIIAKTQGAAVAVAGLPADAARLTLAKEVGADLTFFCSDEQDPGLGQLMEMTGGLGPNIVLECSGTAGGINQGLNLCRSGGRYVQIGTQSSQVTVDFMRIAYKEIKVTGTIGHTRLDWEQTVPFVARNQERIRPLLRNYFPLRDWKKAFSIAEGKEAAKVVLLPPIDK